MSRRDDVIAEIARRHGVLLPPDDPVLHIDTMLELSEARIQALVERLEAAGSSARFTEEQVHTLGRHLAAGCSALAGRMRSALEWRTVAIIACALLAAVLVGGAVVYWGIDGSMRGMQCGYGQSGQWMCWAPPPAGKH